MSDSSIFAGPLGPKVGSFLGSLATLAFTAHKLKKGPAAISVLIGFLGSYYMTEILIHFYINLREIEEPVSFLFGLISMNIMGGMFVKFARFRKTGNMTEFQDVKDFFGRK